MQRDVATDGRRCLWLHHEVLLGVREAELLPLQLSIFGTHLMLRDLL